MLELFYQESILLFIMENIEWGLVNIEKQLESSVISDKKLENTRKFKNVRTFIKRKTCIPSGTEKLLNIDIKTDSRSLELMCLNTTNEKWGKGKRD
jgi:hypothetical protein